MLFLLQCVIATALPLARCYTHSPSRMPGVVSWVDYSRQRTESCPYRHLGSDLSLLKADAMWFDLNPRPWIRIRVCYPLHDSAPLVYVMPRCRPYLCTRHIFIFIFWLVLYAIWCTNYIFQHRKNENLYRSSISRAMNLSSSRRSLTRESVSCM